MNIANPIYDAVFKYLLEDNKIAKLLLSAIIGQEIEELEYRPEELKVRKKKKTGNKELTFWSVYRVDFAAKIKTPKGSSLVVIEIQKAKYPSSIMRFREYLGKQYGNQNNAYAVNEPVAAYGKKALPIISIYFLGHKLQYTDAPVIQVLRNYYDAATKKEIKTKEEFIESLSHDSYVIQIPYLKEKRRNDLELLLSVFDQDNITNNKHILNIDEEYLPERYKIVIRRLQMAIADAETTKNMELEDEIIGDFRTFENELIKKDKTIEEKDKTIEENKKTIEELKRKLDNKK